ncbi:hypothetical protein PPERSA_03159 [Pseudocohnilembus persalinus]|uniref:COMM domain-containing protein n=1 Tax=Pseudocohnilembus persalinus TaxID=266149 RepID=A0A0V0QIG9_PSEPJ|nr:hypothetical protein PPERSA_03159 [Pseudocohnilembus persalinus]|eukprot:KRX02097.1 hypothetical protein PPERSA_03159 [Pseudocohnilembus persalinus]
MEVMQNQTRLENFQKELRLKFEKLENDQTPQFQNLKWRLDLQIASRSYQEIFAPKILLQLDLLKGEKTEGVLLETDYANLKHLHEELQLALKAHQTARQKKIQKLFY